MDIAKQVADPGRVWLLDDANDVHRFRLRTGEKDEAYAAHSVASVSYTHLSCTTPAAL